MDRREALHEQLCGVMAELGLPEGQVYFQPPEGMRIAYPCIVYERERIESDHADNRPYRTQKRYTVTAIDKDPDSRIPDRIAALETSRHERHFVSDNLHHDTFTLYD